MKSISRGDIWLVDFNPSVGTEIQKVRPAVVVQVDGLSKLSSTIVVPITGWRSHFTSNVWMYYLPPTAQNGLEKESCVDTLQIKSIDNSRFRNYMGSLNAEDMDEIAATIAYCVGYSEEARTAPASDP